MKKIYLVWVCWLLCLLSAAMAYLFANDTLTLTLLVCALFLPLIFIVIAVVIHRRITVDMVCTESCSRGQTITGSLYIGGAGCFPVGFSIVLECRNLRTGECEKFAQNTGFSGRKHGEYIFSVKALHSGVMQIRVISLYVQDIFGIIRIPCRAEAECETLIRPNLFETEITLSQSNVSVPESNQYAPDKTGNDPSETIALREYVPGDMVKKIHWKLSGKLGKAVVREFGFPLIEQVAVLLETSTTGELSGGEYDTIADVYYSVLMGLCQQHIDCTAGYPGADGVCLHKILTSEDLDIMMSQWLRISGTVMGESCAEVYAKTNAGQAVSHLILVGERGDFNPAWLTNGGKLVLLLLSKKDMGQIPTEKGIMLIPFGEESYSDTLCRLDF